MWLQGLAFSGGGGGILRGYLAHENSPPPTVGLYLGSYGGPWGGGAVSYERGTPVPNWKTVCCAGSAESRNVQISTAQNGGAGADSQP